MTVLINILGGAGVGKSTMAADIFTNLKKRGRAVELVREEIKNEIWQGKTEFPFADQFYFFGVQARRENALFGKVDFVVSECPVLLVGFYATKRFSGSLEKERLFITMVKKYYAFLSSDNVTVMDYGLIRETTFSPVGRIHGEEESIEIDKEIRTYYETCKGLPLKITSLAEANQVVLDAINRFEDNR